MKKTISIIVVVLVVGLIIVGGWFFVYSKNSVPSMTSNPDGSLPSGSPPSPLSVESKAQNGTVVYVQGISSPQDPQVAKDFLGGIQNADQIALGGTVITPQYALQVWGDTNKGGEALLEYTSSTGWGLVSLGGGQWTTLGLIQEGVPVSVAKQLAAGVTNGSSPSPSTSPIAIPPGDSITIGTAQGSIAMNNFYKNASYIDQDQRAVLIQQTSTYNILYDLWNSSFTLTVFGTSFTTARAAGEQSFLTTLGISKADACKLSVRIDAVYVVGSPFNNRVLPLSFCKGGAFQAQ